MYNLKGMIRKSLFVYSKNMDFYSQYKSYYISADFMMSIYISFVFSHKRNLQDNFRIFLCSG